MGDPEGALADLNAAIVLQPDRTFALAKRGALKCA